MTTLICRPSYSITLICLAGADAIELRVERLAEIAVSSRLPGPVAVAWR